MKYLFLFILVMAVVTACSPTEPVDTKMIDDARAADIHEAIVLANGWRSSSPKVTSYITAEKLTIDFPDGTKIEKQLPEDSMYIAVAPYINYTHTCATHYLSSCDAELKEKDFNIEIKDEAGNTILSKEMRSLNNGFIELWLPRDKTLNLNIEHDNLFQQQEITTFTNSKTCITTMKLE